MENLRETKSPGTKTGAMGDQRSSERAVAMCSTASRISLATRMAVDVLRVGTMGTSGHEKAPDIRGE